MQFVKNGPNVPEKLLQAHEDGRVIYFCGAGISYPAGLPDFKGLVERIYSDLGIKQEGGEIEAFERGNYDAVLYLLESRVVGNRFAIRKVVWEALQVPKWTRKAASTHRALLELSTSRADGQSVRLVTTNFDRIFLKLAQRQRPSIGLYDAPLLPIPKDSRWHGIVHLHGLLPVAPDKKALNRLVLSSGDFGLAYLTERWASRFVAELFRNYVVCFVGYSINDPVLRYMMDALAADRMLGEETQDAYAFGAYEGEEDQASKEWLAKGVTPILYNASKKNHDALHKTLSRWAETYRDGVRGKERIVAECGLGRPLASTKQDDFVGRLMWALCDESGLPAKYFADLDPAPSLEWLEPFSDSRFGHHDLTRFGVTPSRTVDNKLAFSFLRRFTSYAKAPRMSLVRETAGAEWDEVMFQLARWLTRYLDAPELLHWVAKAGGRLHERLCLIIEEHLNRLAKLDAASLANLKQRSPQAIPRPVLAKLWRLVLSGRTGIRRRNALELYMWRQRFEREGMTFAARMQLAQLLSPSVEMKPPYKGFFNDEAQDPNKLSNLVSCEVLLSAEDADHSLKALSELSQWKEALPGLFEEFERLLSQAVELLHEIDRASPHFDSSHWDLPSISPHWQNRGYKDWVWLIELVRDSWLGILQSDPHKAVVLASGWWSKEYPVFKRLALYAWAQPGISTEVDWVGRILSDGGRWLWSTETMREVMRLLVAKGAQAAPEQLAALEQAVCLGPPRDMFRPEIEESEWRRVADGMISLRLGKLQYGGASLGKKAKDLLERLAADKPGRAISDSERDEFSSWMSGTGDPDFERDLQVDRAPRDLDQLVTWLAKPAEQDRFHYTDDWRDLCQQRPILAMRALVLLSQRSVWPSDRWQEALQVWSGDKFPRVSWRILGRVLPKMPPEPFAATIHGISYWLQAVSKHGGAKHSGLLTLCRRVLVVPSTGGFDTDEPVGRAINHPVGHVAQAVFSLWFQEKPDDKQGLQEPYKAIFSEFADVRIEQFRHARVLMAANAIALFRVDPSWASERLLPLFEWKRSLVEARAAWSGFLWAPRAYYPLLEAMAPAFLETATHATALGDFAKQYASLLTFVALDRPEAFSAEKLRTATQSLSGPSRVQCAQAVVHALDGAGAQREEQWRHRVAPYWRKVWPREMGELPEHLGEVVARIPIAAGDCFPDALEAVDGWLSNLDHANYTVDKLLKSELCTRYPQQAITFLKKILSDKSWPPPELAPCLDQIRKAWPRAEKNRDYQELREYIRKRNV